MAFKATILQQQGKSYKIQVKQGADIYIHYRSYSGVDKINQDMAALEAFYNDSNKKAAKDAENQARKDQKNIDKVKQEINKSIKSLSYIVPKTANATQTKINKLQADLQAAINTFIGSL